MGVSMQKLFEKAFQSTLAIELTAAILQDRAFQMVNSTESTLAHFTFPRTGKRGVPQQFPRRLYEMLESETKLAEQDAKHRVVIAWSDSGKAFRILNVMQFADEILPRYFRTKKFSSFQRNLNLYGFMKIRKGPETDMYAHPSFVKDQPKSLLNLRKVAPATCRRRLSSCDSSSSNTSNGTPRAASPPLRSVMIDLSAATAHQSKATPHSPPVPSSVTLKFGNTADRGKLDLLAMALEHEFATVH